MLTQELVQFYKDNGYITVSGILPDAWPLTEMPESLEAFNAMMIAGEAPVSPRLAEVHVRLPLPRPVDWEIRKESIFDKQRDLRNSPFARARSQSEISPKAAAGD